MTSRPLESALKESVLKGFFDMAFIEVIPVHEAPGTQIPYTNVFVIQSIRPRRMELQFFFPLESKKLIVENIYTRDWSELPSRMVDDCILEMINVVGGNFFSLYFGDDCRYEMGLPSIRFSDEELIKGETFHFSAEGIPFKVVVTID
jgi:hypothetical protein